MGQRSGRGHAARGAERQESIRENSPVMGCSERVRYGPSHSSTRLIEIPINR